MLIQAKVPVGLLLVLPFDANIIYQDSCLRDNFFGNYLDGGRINSIISVSSDSPCIDSLQQYVQPSNFTLVPELGKQLVWVEQTAVADSLKAIDGAYMGQGNGNQEALHLNPSRDDPLVSLQTLYQVHHRTKGAALLSVDSGSARNIDTLLPRYWKSTLLSQQPISYIPVPDAAIEPVRQVLSKLKFDPIVASVVNNISIPHMKNDIRFLTGEDGVSGIISRHSFSLGAITAAHWLKQRFEDTGAKCKLKLFLEGFAPNVVCRYASTRNTNDTIIISGHYDSRGSFGSTRAPGGDDDGSGTTAILAIARTIARKGVKFHRNVELVAFAGEEQGLLGSKAYARELREAGENITLMIQADMLAYRAPGEPLQLGLPDIIGTPEVTQLVANISAIYSPELVVGYTPACCSDHQSFHEQGYPSTQVFERAGPIVDPMYHNSGDLSDREGYSFVQLYAIAKVQFATVLHTAGFELED
ncbi:Zn-dependent exopeptidase [Cyathus striatus]|nr:Zn-dependent exopeptidase [Cyathus striatus]